MSLSDSDEHESDSVEGNDDESDSVEGNDDDTSGVDADDSDDDGIPELVDEEEVDYDPDYDYYDGEVSQPASQPASQSASQSAAASHAQVYTVLSQNKVTGGGVQGDGCCVISKSTGELQSAALVDGGLCGEGKTGVVRYVDGYLPRDTHEALKMSDSLSGFGNKGLPRHERSWSLVQQNQQGPADQAVTEQLAGVSELAGTVLSYAAPPTVNGATNAVHALNCELRMFVFHFCSWRVH
jgi:hypothetical protein